MKDKQMKDASINRTIIYSSFICASLILLAACAAPNKTQRPRAGADEIRSEQIEQQKLADEAWAQGGLKKAWRNRPKMHKQFENAAMRVEEKGADVCREMGIPSRYRGCYFYFEISRDRDLNASADGKTVYLNGGLLRFLQNEDEVAIVLAHELAHNIMGHADMRAQNADLGTLIGIATGAIAESGNGRRSRGYDTAGRTSGMLAYSEDFEREADYVGLYIAARAGYDISKALGLWRRLSVEFPDNIYNGATHPSNAERFVYIRKTIEEINHKRKQKKPLVPELGSTN